MKEAFKQQMQKELREAQTMQEIFNILSKYYDLENCRPGQITKAVILNYLQKGVSAINAKAKKQYA